MAYNPIPDNLIDVGDPVKKEIFQMIQDNEDDFDSRLNNLEGSTAKIVVFNQVLEKPQNTHKVGDTIISYLDLAEFIKQHDSSWILANGQSVVGSLYGNLTGKTTAPDMRGRYIRIKDNGAGVNPDGEIALGDFQADILKSHNHSDAGHSHPITDKTHTHTIQNDSHSHPITDVAHSHPITQTGHSHGVTDPQHSHGITDPSHKHGLLQAGGSTNRQVISRHANWSNNWIPAESDLIEYATTGITVNNAFTSISINNANANISVDNANSGITTTSASATGGNLTSNGTTLSTTDSGTASINNTGGLETRPKTITANAFIKINESSWEKALVFKSAYTFNLTSAIINSLLAGDSGTLQIDIKKGTSLNSLATVFSTRPSLDYTAGNYSNSSNADFSTIAVSPGEWLVVDIMSMQHGQNRFHVFVMGEV